MWASDITYIRLRHGFVFLVVIMDWFSRYVLSWKLSITLEKEFCIEALKNALAVSKPEIFNSDQGGQYTSDDFTGVLKAHEIIISMDGRGRLYDNIFVERLWRNVKYEEVYINDYQRVQEAKEGLSDFFCFYNTERPHASLNGRTPFDVYHRIPAIQKVDLCQGFDMDNNEFVESRGSHSFGFLIKWRKAIKSFEARTECTLKKTVCCPKDGGEVQLFRRNGMGLCSGIRNY